MTPPAIRITSLVQYYVYRPLVDAVGMDSRPKVEFVDDEKSEAATPENSLQSLMLNHNLSPEQRAQLKQAIQANTKEALLQALLQKREQLQTNCKSKNSRNS